MDLKLNPLVCVCVSVCLSVCLSVFLSVCLSVQFTDLELTVQIPRDENGEVLLDTETTHLATWRAMEQVCLSFVVVSCRRWCCQMSSIRQMTIGRFHRAVSANFTVEKENNRNSTARYHLHLAFETCF